MKNRGLIGTLQTYESLAGQAATVSPSKRPLQLPTQDQPVVKKPKRTIEQLFRKAQPPVPSRSSIPDRPWPARPDLQEGGDERGGLGARPAGSPFENIAERVAVGGGEGSDPPAGGATEGLCMNGVEEEDQELARVGEGGAEHEVGLPPQRSSPAAQPGDCFDGLAAESSERVGAQLADERGGAADVRDRGLGEGSSKVGGVETMKENGADPEGGRAGDGDGGPGEGLEGIDMEEQRRIMHEIWVRKNLQKPAVAPGQRKSVKKNEAQGTPKQPRLTDMFCKRH